MENSKNRKYIVLAIIEIVMHMVFTGVYYFVGEFSIIIAMIVGIIIYVPIWLLLFFLSRDERVPRAIRIISEILVWWMPINVIVVYVLVFLGKATVIWKPIPDSITSFMDHITGN